MSKKLDAKDAFGARMKRYEANYERKLVDRLFTIIRLDGVSFSRYTKGLNRPFDKGLSDDMLETTKYLVQNIQGAIFGYTQSDEISLVLYTGDNINAQIWFDGKLNKILSNSSSMATAKFNQLRRDRNPDDKRLPIFDSRVFQLPDVIEAINAILWRQQDSTKNSISQTASSLYSHGELEYKDGVDKQELIFQKGELLKEKLIKSGFELPDKSNFNWNDLPVGLKRGRIVAYTNKIVELTQKKLDLILKNNPDNPNLFEEGGKWYLNKKTLDEVEAPILSTEDNLINYFLKVNKTYNV